MNTRHSPSKANSVLDPASGSKPTNKHLPVSQRKKTARKSTSKSSDKFTSKPGSRFREQPKDIEIGVDGDDFEIEPDQSNRIEKKKASPRKGTVPAAPGNIDFEKPFKLGWGRELVIHGKPGSNLKHDVDVCYFSPEGKKLKTRTEIKAHLLKTKSPLTIDSFTFETETVYEEPFEIIRYTGKPKGKGKSKKSAESCDSKAISSKETSHQSLDKSIVEDGNKKGQHSEENKDETETHTSEKTSLVDRNSHSIELTDNAQANDDEKNKAKSDSNEISGKTKEVSPKTLAKQRRSKRVRRSTSKSLNDDDSSNTADSAANNLETRKESENELNKTDNATPQYEENVQIQTNDIGDKNDVVITAELDNHKEKKKYNTDFPPVKQKIDITSDSTYTKTVVTIEKVNAVETEDIENIRTVECEAVENESDCFGIKISAVESIADISNKTTEVDSHGNKRGTQGASDLGERDNQQTDINEAESEETSNSANSHAHPLKRNDNTYIGSKKRKQDLRKKLIVNSSWLKIKPKVPRDSVIEVEHTGKPTVIGTIGSITLQKPNRSSLLKAGSKFKSVKSSTLLAKSPMVSKKSIVIPKIKTNFKIIKRDDTRPKTAVSKSTETKSTDSSPNKRRRTLPARLRDYAVVNAKDTESSQESEVESGEEEDDDMNSAEQEHFISNVNPSTAELISSVLGQKRGNVAKKHTGKRKLTGIDALHPDATAAKKKKVPTATLR